MLASPNLALISPVTASMTPKHVWRSLSYLLVDVSFPLIPNVVLTRQPANNLLSTLQFRLYTISVGEASFKSKNLKFSSDFMREISFVMSSVARATFQDFSCIMAFTSERRVRILTACFRMVWLPWLKFKYCLIFTLYFFIIH